MLVNIPMPHFFAADFGRKALFSFEPLSLLSFRTQPSLLSCTAEDTIHAPRDQSQTWHRSMLVPDREKMIDASLTWTFEKRGPEHRGNLTKFDIPCKLFSLGFSNRSRRLSESQHHLQRAMPSMKTARTAVRVIIAQSASEGGVPSEMDIVANSEHLRPFVPDVAESAQNRACRILCVSDTGEAEAGSRRRDYRGLKTEETRPTDARDVRSRQSR